MFRKRIKSVLEGAESQQPVTISGWVRTKRKSKNFAFVVVNDGSTQKDLQVIIDAEKEAFLVVDKVSTGSSIRIDGVLVASPGKGQEWEVHADTMELIGLADPASYPLQKKGHSLEFLREMSHIRGRTNTLGAVFRVRNRLSQLVHAFFQGEGFIWAHTPIITSNDCEGAGELFRVTTLDIENPPRDDKGEIDYSRDFFGKPVHLAVSGQLNGEAMALSLGDIYTFGPTFRAENSNTTRHLSEFWMVEPEMAFADLRQNATLAEDFLKYLFRNIVEQCPNELDFLSKYYEDCQPDSLLEMSQRPFQRISYTDAVAELEKSRDKFEFSVEWGCDLQTEHEKFLSEQVFKGPVIVTDYPKDIKAFYMRMNSDNKTVAAMDVLVPRIGEIIGGSQREERRDLLESRMDEMKIDRSALGWYLDLRSQGGCPHAGFGLGFERLVQYVTGMVNIRDVIPFPRSPHTVGF